jgi:hypothetical protein
MKLHSKVIFKDPMQISIEERLQQVKVVFDTIGI